MQVVDVGGGRSRSVPLSRIHRAVGPGIGGGSVAGVKELQAPSSGHPPDPPQAAVQPGTRVRPLELVKGYQCERRASCGVRFVKDLGHCTRPEGGCTSLLVPRVPRATNPVCPFWVYLEIRPLSSGLLNAFVAPDPGDSQLEPG
jgi:hypothetical protein